MLFVASHIIQKSDKLKIMKDLNSSNTKNKHWPIQENRGEDGHSFSFKKGDVPWILKKEDLNLVKEIILGVKVPSFYWCSLQCCFATDENLLGLKSHEHLNLLRVRIMPKTIYIDLIYILPQIKMQLIVCVYIVVSLSVVCAWMCEP